MTNFQLVILAINSEFNLEQDAKVSPEVVGERDVQPGHLFALVQLDVVDCVALLQGAAVDPQKRQDTLLRVVNDFEGHGAKVSRLVVAQKGVRNLFRSRQIVN